MITGSGKGGFLQAHYDLVALGVGGAALVGAVLFAVVGGDVEDEINDIAGGSAGGKASGASVAELAMNAYVGVTNGTKVAARFADLPEKAESFLASEKRILCASKTCGKATPEVFDADKNLLCAFCGHTQTVAKVEAPADGDGDGMADEWERKVGLDPKDPSDAAKDMDGDEFTNLEEYLAKTDPKDPKDHPDYLDSLKIVLPLKNEYMPFVFTKANKIPAGWRCDFVDPSRKDDYGRPGRKVSIKVGEKVIDVSGKEKFDYGFTLKSYTAKTEKREKKGMAGMKVDFDVSEVVLVRERDGKQVTLQISGPRAKPIPMDVQATLAYERGSVKNFTVVPGAEIVLSGNKYKVTDIKAVGQGAEVTVENALHPNQKRTLKTP